MGHVHAGSIACFSCAKVGYCIGACKMFVFLLVQKWDTVCKRFVFMSSIT